MSAHTRALDATTAMTGELTVDLVWLVRPRRYYWVTVGVGVLVGAIAGAAFGAILGWQWFFILSGVIVFGGLGMNVGIDFYFLALSPSGLYLVDSSRVTPKPVRKAVHVARGAIGQRPGPMMSRLTIGGREYIAGARYRDRLQRMLA